MKPGELLTTDEIQRRWLGFGWSAPLVFAGELFVIVSANVKWHGLGTVANAIASYTGTLVRVKS